MGTYECWESIGGVVLKDDDGDVRLVLLAPPVDQEHHQRLTRDYQGYPLDDAIRACWPDWTPTE